MRKLPPVSVTGAPAVSKRQLSGEIEFNSGWYQKPKVPLLLTGVPGFSTTTSTLPVPAGATARSLCASTKVTDAE